MENYFALNAHFVWGVPVKPDTLGEHLEAYEICLPSFETLRLCRQFGRGPNVHITKLPTEILLVIEEMIFEHFKPLASKSWADAFRHFERRCEPLDHVTDRSTSWLKDAEDSESCRENLCASCRDSGADVGCPKGCDKIIRKMQNKAARRVSGLLPDACNTERERWLHLIDQNSNGHFERYDELLLRYFGLEATFSTTRANAADVNAWPHNQNFRWHKDEALETTICYLTLPRQAIQKQIYEVSEREHDDIPERYRIDVYGTHSSIVELPTMSEHDKRIKQFRRALKALQLEPLVHSSQLRQKLSSDLGQKELHVAKDMDTLEWPQPIMLIKGTFAQQFRDC